MLLSVDQNESPASRSLSFEIVSAIAEAEGIDSTSLEPPEYESLYDVVNPEALDALFAPRENGTPRGSGRVEFDYCGYHVVVTDDGSVDVRDQ